MSKRIYIISLFCICFLFPYKAVAQSTVITGIVTDSVTNEPLPYVSVFLKGPQVGVTTDDEGRFSIKTSSAFSKIIFTSLGYRGKEISVKRGGTRTLEVKLVPSTYDVKEVIVRPKRERYKRKGNPAVDFVKNIIERRDQNSPENHDYYNYEQYDKLTLALNDFSEEQKKKWLFKKFQFIFDYVDTSEVSGKPILTVSIKEKIAENHYRKSPTSHKQQVTGIKRAGIDEMFNQESLQQFYDEVFKEVDIFGNDVTMLLTRFVSPLSNIGPAFYRYYLMDTIQIEGEKCVDLAFAPFNSESTGFVGHLYVTLDSTYFVKKAKLTVPKTINLNYVENLVISQDFKRFPDGTRIKTKDDAVVEFRILPGTQGLYARRLSTYTKHNFSSPADMSIFSKEGRVIVDEMAEVKPEAFWIDNRHVAVKSKENAVDKLLVRLREVPVFYWTEKVISILISGYIETSKESKFDFGPMNTTISGNSVEGARFRVGGLTTANLNPHWFGNGYLAYGTRDKKFKYKAELQYSFNKKKYHPGEFPVHSIRLMHSYDINQLGQHYLYTNKDNVFLALKRMEDVRSTYLRNTELGYLREHKFGFSYGLDLRYKTEEATKWVPFKPLAGNEFKRYSEAEAEIKLRYAPNEKFYQTKGQRYPITKDAPVFTLSHVVGLKGVFDSKYNYNRTDFSVRKAFWFSAFGHLNVMLQAGKVWNKVPYPMLIIPNANLSYLIQQGSYSLMNPMEFINDSYASWDLTYFANGILFNRIPLVKYMKLREVISFKGMFGHLSDKNNPALHPDSDFLWAFPSTTRMMDKKTPYMEFGAGLDNIFTILRVEYVWRLTYRNHPGIDRSGVRIAMHFSF